MEKINNTHLYIGGKRMKRLLVIVVLASMFIMCLNHTNYVFANENEEDSLQLAEKAKAALLLERDTGKVLYEKNAHEKLPPASLTKVMTLLLVMEAIDQGKLKKDELITVSQHASSMGGSQIFLAEGEQMSVDDLIKAVAIASANDASVALAERISGSEPAFVKLMNDKVRQLNLENTMFQNASGLPAKNHYTTAYDIGIISKELLKYEDITNYTSIYEDYLRKGEENEFWLVNTNRLVRFFPYVDGLKTGYTKEAKFCLTATAKKDDMRVVSVIMGAESSKERNAMTMSLIDYAFNHYEADQIYAQKDLIGKYTNVKSKKFEYSIKTNEPITILRQKGEAKIDYETDIVLFEKQLPIEKGEQIGKLVIKKDGDSLYESPLYANEAIEYGSIFTLMKRVTKNIVKND